MTKKIDTIYIIKTPRREKNSLSKMSVHKTFETDIELVSFMNQENLIIDECWETFTSDILDYVNKLDKVVLIYDEMDDCGNQIYLPYILSMVREECKNKSDYIKNAIRKYKLDILLNGKEEDTTSEDM